MATKKKAAVAKKAPATKKAVVKKAPSAVSVVLAAVESIADGDHPKPLKDGRVKIHLHSSLDGKRTKAEKFIKGEMKDTLDRIWWNARWKARKDGLSVYSAFEAIGRMPLENISGKAYMVLTTEECEAASK